MSTISPDTLTAELRLRAKSQNYGGVFDAISQFKQETSTARGAAGGNAVGELVGGLESLIGVSHNAVEDAESTAKAVIAKVTPSGHGIETLLHPGMTDAEIASLDAIMKNAAIDISTVFGPAITSVTAASKMNHKIIIDSSPEAATAALKKAANLTNNLPLKALQKSLAPEGFKELVESAVNKMESKEVQADVSNMLATVQTELKKTTGGVDSGNLLKDISEDVSRNLSKTIGGFGDEFTRLKSLPIINDLLGGNNALGLDKAISTLKIDPSLLTKAGSLGIGTNIGSLLDMKGFIKQMDKLAPDLASLSTTLKTSVDKAITTLDKSKTSIASVVTDNNTSPHETADVTDTTKDKRFKTLSSVEEIVSVLKSSRRPLTTIVWHWTGHYTDDRNIGAFQIDQEYLAESKRIPFHFVIAKNGDIQTGFPISSGSAHVASQFNALSFGVAFVGGYNGARGDRPLVKLSSNSYTVAQWKSFYAFMKAFYIAIPGGDAFGQNELSENAPGEGPGFTVNSIIKLHPFNRKNTCEPISDGKFLTREEIIAKLI